MFNGSFARHTTSSPPDALNAEGTVPPRVLKEVLEQGQFADDDVYADYLAGVLASSRTETGRDDRALAYSAVLSGLSTYAIRSHYLFYMTAHRLLLGSGIDFRKRHERVQVFVPATAYAAAMAFSREELQDYSEIVADVFISLSRYDDAPEPAQGVLVSALSTAVPSE